MKIINHAYETLSDPIKRREHWIEKQENDSALEINKHHEQQPTQGMQEDLKKIR
jgi:curved DNA-binding protein CbpA